MRANFSKRPCPACGCHWIAAWALSLLNASGEWGWETTSSDSLVDCHPDELRDDRRRNYTFDECCRCGLVMS